MKKLIIFFTAVLLLNSCEKKDDFDASGNFEADEVIVSAQQNGELISYSVQEGTHFKKGDQVGQIDVKTAVLQKEQAEANIQALHQKTSTPDAQDELVKKQLAVLESQLEHQLHERTRTANLVKADAATRKQLDDIDAGIDQLRKQIVATRQQLSVNNSNYDTQNRSILSEAAPLEKTVAQFQEQINKGQIINPINGTVLVNYALQGEMQVVGKPLYKIANTDTLDLRAYITGTQLSQIKLNQQVKVRIDQGEKNIRNIRERLPGFPANLNFPQKRSRLKMKEPILSMPLKSE